MSGGAWGYQQYRLEEKAEMLRTELAEILEAVAKTEHLVDWAVCCDTSKETAAPLLFDLWHETFNSIYKDYG